MFEDQKPISRMALKVGIAGFIGFGAIATGLFVTRKGRHLVREAWEGRERTRIEDRVLDALWSDPRLARRRLDVAEGVDGQVKLVGIVRSNAERHQAVDIAAGVKGVSMVLDAIEVVPREKRRRA
ncbi:MAG TPA: BON domain-containing protein [Longimicrobiales bacterium]|nr:BON domain-containing protein [Longimicrobiales bacterium]